MRTRAGAEDLAIGRWSCGSAVTREGDEADRWGRLVSVSQRGEEGGSDERDPLVSDRAERGQRAQRPRGPGGSGPACEPISGRSLQCFSFSFLCSFCFIFEFVS